MVQLSYVLSFKHCDCRITMWTSVLLCGLLLHGSLAYKTLNLLSYVQLPTSLSRGAFVYSGIDLGTATAAAYDFANNIVYVLGTV